MVDAAIRADLLVDCAASWPLTRYLAATCRELDRPILVASATGGARGGIVAHLTGTSACWACLEHHRADGRLPVPPALPGDEILPVGCGLPTFTGAGYELGHVSLHAVRVAVDLLGGGDGLGGQVHTLSQWRDGRPAPARWETARLEQHPACPVHEHAAAQGVS